MSQSRFFLTGMIGALGMAAWINTLPVCAADAPASDKERPLIAVIQSEVPPQDKALAFKQLAIYGSRAAVPALAPYLCDVGLASWARTALEAIPGPEAEQALRDAMDKVDGRLLVGTINSIGFRRDALAIPKLSAKLRDADADVASAAAAALGRIGGPRSARALLQVLPGATGIVRGEVAEGCILCAERFLMETNASAAARLYDTVRRADVPQNKKLEAIRGAILARRSKGIPLLVEQLHSPDKALFNLGLRVARELAGRQATEAVAEELDRAPAERQGRLLLALGDRGDASAVPKILQIAGNGTTELRVIALGLLEKLGDASSVPVLLQAAAQDNADVAKAAKNTLARLPGKEVDAAILARLSDTAGKQRQAVIELAGQRRIEGALAAIVPSAEDADAAVRRAAVETIGALGQEAQAGALVRLLQKSANSDDRSTLEKALLRICGRCGARCVPALLPLVQSGEAAQRIAGLRALASVGGSPALTSVKSALDDPDAGVQDEAVRTLSTWANNWPEDEGVAEPLLALAKSGRNPAQRVLGLRGYLEYVQADRKLSNGDKVAKISALSPLMTGVEEKRLAISALGALPTTQALEPLVAFAADPALTEEACLAIVTVASNRGLQGGFSAPAIDALKTVLAKSNNDRTKRRAQAILKRVQP